jgi:hypothetical protein
METRPTPAPQLALPHPSAKRRLIMSNGRPLSPSQTQQIRIDYVSEGFSPGDPVSNGYAILNTSWDELVWAALTVGRPNRQYVFRHGVSSMYEALFRLSLVRMALEQSGPTASRLRRTAAARTLDPSEKGAVNYFLGIVMCKLFSARLLDAPWVLHLDVFRPQLNPVLTGRSRPDLVGQTGSGGWLALESKGRVSPPISVVKSKAKEQAERLVSVNGVPPSFQIGAVTFFRNDVLHFFWRDPKPEDRPVRNPIEIRIDETFWSHYYGPALELLRAYTGDSTLLLGKPAPVPLKELDVELGIHPVVVEHLVAGKWELARKSCLKNKEELLRDGYRPDGIRIVAGPSWSEPFSELDRRAH